LVGFNNLYYDTPIIDYILYENPTNQDIFEYSTSLISRLNSGIGAVVQRNYNWDEIDLMKLYAFDALGVSLKQISINLQWHRVQDLPFQFDQKIKQEDLHTVLDYNLNDVLITAELYFRSHAEINLRRNLSVAYNLDLRSASDSRMANLMLNDIYSK